MKYVDLRQKVRPAVFSLQDLRLRGLKVFSYQFTLWQKKGYVVKLKNGFYVFADRLAGVAPEELAPLLYSPSYISLEKALSVYGFIPEMVYAVTSVTPKATRRFKNRVGSFTYRHIKPPLFFGYKELRVDKSRYLLAEPEKALLDFVYLNLSRLKTPVDITSARLNLANIRKGVSPKKLAKYLSLFKSQRMETALQMILGG